MPKTTAEELRAALSAIRKKKIFVLYKRLVKKTPLDKELLEKVAGLLQPKVDVEKIQRQFDFS